MKKSKTLLLSVIALLAALAIACNTALPGDGGSTAERDGGPSSNAAIAQSQDSVTGDVTEPSLYGRGSVTTDGAVPEIDPQLGSATLDRKIIENTTIDVSVDGENGVSRSFQDIVGIAETAGGFVASSSFTNVDGKQYGDVTIRVPATQYQSVLAEIRGMGTVSQEGSDANDVTEEYTDLEARLRTLNATEQRYLDLLAQANTINDILTVQDRLDVIRGQIEQVVGRMNLLDNLTDLATITVHLSPAVVAVDSSGGSSLTPVKALKNAWQSSLTVLEAIAIGAVSVVAFSWWLVPALAIVAMAMRRWLRRDDSAPTAAQSP